MKRYFILLLLILTVFPSEIFSQKNFMIDGISSSDRISTSDFNNKLFQKVLFHNLNAYMDSVGLEGFEPHEFFFKPSMEHSIMMKDNDNASLIEKGKLKTVRDRLISSGGSGIGAELVVKLNTKNSDGLITYNELVSQVLEKWTKGKNARILFEQNYFLALAFACVDDSGKRIYISMYMGNYSSFSHNTDNEKNLAVALTTKKHGLLPYDEGVCKKGDKLMPIYTDLYEGLSIEDGKIILEHSNLKTINKIIKEPKDGFAVDIIQKSQFACGSENIINFANINYGFLTKPIYRKQIFATNMAEGEGKQNKQKELKVEIADIPNGLEPEDIELNLMIIKDNHVCANIKKTWIDKKAIKTLPKINLLPDTVETELSKYAPIATSSELKFRVPFEQGKYNYNPEDIAPMLKALDKPEFIINKIYITAYSSLEGNNTTNSELQKKRAQSIVKALEQHQNASIVDSIVTSTNFEDFKKDVIGTKYETAAKMQLEEASKYVNSRYKEMEEILKNHRYADIVIWVTYETESATEQEYAVSQFNKAVQKKDLDYTLKIQKYILKRVVEGRYTYKALEGMQIPEGLDYIGLIMNKIWLKQYINMDEIDNEYSSMISKLNKLDNSNIYIEYNDILCNILLSNLTNKTLRENIQKRIDKLYNTSMSVHYVDLLNIELQFQIIKAHREILEPNNQLFKDCVNNIKHIIKFEKLDWQNSLKLAQVFINYSDYKYAVNLLEPFIDDANTPFILLSTYITACSKVENKTQSNKFVKAVEKVIKEDKDFFCKLYKNGKFSIQTLTNTKLKEKYCKTCK